jgi:four helix bundle protein
MRSKFRDLAAYRLSADAGDMLHRTILGWPSFERWTLGVQLIRAADSIGANIAEASGRMHAPDRRRLLIIARGSLHETEHWLARAAARDLPTAGCEQGLKEIALTLNGLINRGR